MVLESTVVCLDDSQYMRYDDFQPSRMHAQGDSARIVCLSKMQADPENEVALVTMSGPEVLVPLTTDADRVLNALAEIRPKGEIDLVATLRVAYCMLKNREDKDHQMRMVIFVGSPVAATIDELDQIAYSLRNKNVNVDFVSYGEYAVNMGKLTNFVTILNGLGFGSSRLVSVPAPNNLSSVVAGSPIVQGSDYRSFINLEVDIDPAFFLDQQVSLEEHDYEAEASQENSSGTYECRLLDLVRDYEREHGPFQIGSGHSTTTEVLPPEEYEIVDLTVDDDEGETGGFGTVDGWPDHSTMMEDEETAFARLTAVTLQDQSCTYECRLLDLVRNYEREHGPFQIGSGHSTTTEVPEQTTPVVSHAEPAESDAMDSDQAKQSAKEDGAGGDEHDGTF